MRVSINGQTEEITAGLILAQFLEIKNILPTSVIVEYNGEICRQEDYQQLVLQENDTLEIITLVGGG